MVTSDVLGVNLFYEGHVIVFVCKVCQLRASFTSFEELLRCAHKCIVNIKKVYIKRNNMRVELIRFRKKYRLYSLLLLEFNATDMFTLGKSLQHKPVR